MKYLLVDALHDAKIDVGVANPARVRDFARGHGYFEKSDAIDAQMLLHYGQESNRLRQGTDAQAFEDAQQYGATPCEMGGKNVRCRFNGSQLTCTRSRARKGLTELGSKMTEQTRIITDSSRLKGMANVQSHNYNGMARIPVFDLPISSFCNDTYFIRLKIPCYEP